MRTDCNSSVHPVIDPVAGWSRCQQFPGPVGRLWICGSTLKKRAVEDMELPTAIPSIREDGSWAIVNVSP